MNMAFSGVAGSRPARGCHLADGDAKSTVKGAILVPAKAGTHTHRPIELAAVAESAMWERRNSK
jgi:hypothetical protein